MKHHSLKYFWLLSIAPVIINAQANKKGIYSQIVTEIETNNQLQPLATELLDVIGPRLVGSPEMQQAHDWVIDTYKNWNIKAENIAYGEWKAWQRGTTEVTLTAPRIKTIDAMQLAWNTNTKKPMEAEIIVMPVFESKQDFENWTKTVKGKLVLISQYQKSGRPESQWKEYATDEDFTTYKATKNTTVEKWNASIKVTGKTMRELVGYLESKGDVGFIQSFFTGTMGSNRIFYSFAKNTQMLEVSLE